MSSGGLSFKEFHCFNLTKLGKQFWSLMQNPFSISARILWAKYFPRGDILQIGLGFQPCYLWRSLLASRELITEGMVWIVGNEKSISICHDRWVGLGNLEAINYSISEAWQNTPWISSST